MEVEIFEDFEPPSKLRLWRGLIFIENISTMWFHKTIFVLIFLHMV